MSTGYECSEPTNIWHTTPLQNQYLSSLEFKKCCYMDFFLKKSLDRASLNVSPCFQSLCYAKLIYSFIFTVQIWQLKNYSFKDKKKDHQYFEATNVLRNHLLFHIITQCLGLYSEEQFGSTLMNEMLPFRLLKRTLKTPIGLNQWLSLQICCSPTPLHWRLCLLLNLKTKQKNIVIIKEVWNNTEKVTTML